MSIERVVAGLDGLLSREQAANLLRDIRSIDEPPADPFSKK